MPHWFFNMARKRLQVEASAMTSDSWWDAFITETTSSEGSLSMMSRIDRGGTSETTMTAEAMTAEKMTAETVTKVWEETMMGRREGRDRAGRYQQQRSW